MNLATSCWECNHGKSGEPLSDVIAGEDPHDRAVLLLERERQLREYDKVLAVVNERLDTDMEYLETYWRCGCGRSLWGAERAGLRNALAKFPSEIIRSAMEIAIQARKTSGLAYVHACLNNWHNAGTLCG